MTLAFPSVVDLRERPEFASIIADRVWRAWWEPKGYALSFIEKLVQKNLNDELIPLALVAHVGGTFLGTASLIVSDLDERSQYTPWVAAVWVEPEHRSKGIGAALVHAGAEKAHALGFDPAYLCASPLKHGFYKRLGWRLVEADVTEAGLAIFRSPSYRKLG
ncbi:GNAT family N-acetyltransferase [Methylobacterium sp. NPDC080182]|uniref:GNAT family N-acetyltransferase n=1 Tax=Methylobacterium sp. NPDC080182 TaxID=3390590 RepID=UPI003D0181F7